MSSYNSRYHSLSLGIRKLTISYFSMRGNLYGCPSAELRRLISFFSNGIGNGYFGALGESRAKCHL